MEPLNIRKVIIQGGFTLVSLILLVRLFFLQVVDVTYKAKAINNSVREVTIYPSRGLVFDRDNRLVVNNAAVYDLVVTPRKVKSLDTLKLCDLLGISKDEFKKSVVKMKQSKGYSSYKPQILFKQIPSDTYARLQEFLYQFPGLYSQVRTVRHYPMKSAPHILGYIGEVNQKQIDTSEYYRLGDYIGASGMEFNYEHTLRGERGIKYMMVDVHNRDTTEWMGGDNNKDAVAGNNLTLTLDMEIQLYAELLMQNKRGSVVAIEPQTGELLALVSSPSYDPNLLAGRMRGAGMKMLTNDTLKPLFNRALMAHYPPGSTFKPLMALIALQEGAIHKNFYYGCAGGYRLGRLTVGCHGHTPCGNVQSSIQHSCNAYYCHIFRLFIEQSKYENVAEGLTRWHDYLNSFGLGRKLNIDLPTELSGYVPAQDLYNKMYGEKRWRASTIISLGIGQGELGVTPLQLSNLMAVIANRGHFYYPHVVRPEPGDNASLYRQKQSVAIDPRHFDTVVEGMEWVVQKGTARIAQIEDVDVCGKTGTAENPHGKSHSLFVAFAPKDNPKIAIAVVVENAGYGSTYAASIASLTIEKYLKGEISEKRKWLEDRMFNADLIHRKKAVVAN